MGDGWRRCGDKERKFAWQRAGRPPLSRRALGRAGIHMRLRNTVPSLAYALATVFLTVPKAHAQGSTPPIRVSIGYGVDTLTVPSHEIFDLWRSYLMSRPDSVRPTTMWSQAEQDRWSQFDLLSGYVYQRFTNFTVVHLAPAVGLDSTYLIRTLIARVDDSLGTVKPLALYAVYATKEGERWVLANALPRRTRAWSHQTVGRIRFVFPPTSLFARDRAEQTAHFVDSLAQAFDVSPPREIEYYFTGDLIDTFWAAGLEFFPIAADTAGGRSLVADHLVLVGSSTSGETYRHELSHVLLQQSLVGPKTAYLVAEGLMTWTGGSGGLDFESLMPALRRYLEAHPTLTLEQLLTDPPQRVGTLDVGYDGLAVLCEMVYTTGGIPAIRQLTNAGREPAAVVGSAARLLSIPPAELDRRWRARVAALSHEPRGGR